MNKTGINNNNNGDNILETRDTHILSGNQCSICECVNIEKILMAEDALHLHP